MHQIIQTQVSVMGHQVWIQLEARGPHDASHALRKVEAAFKAMTKDNWVTKGLPPMELRPPHDCHDPECAKG